MRRSSAQTREHVLDVTHDLFYWQGIRAIGVDRIAAEAQVAPTTLYRLFASKDDLIGAYVERADELYRRWFTEAMQDDGRDPRERVFAVFDELAVQVQPEQCRGCPFQMALAEFPSPDLPAHQRAVSTKNWVREQFLSLAREMDAADPTALADQLTLVMEGVYATVQAFGADGPATGARALVEQLLRPA
jgi:AcrR family transcriptional regulator